MNYFGYRLKLAAAALLGATLALAGCAINPVTGDRELALISEEQEIALGRDSAEQAAQSLGLVEDDALQGYVSEVGLKLARSSERPDLPWEFHVVDDPTPNAFALPGGYIFVTRGLMTLLNSEAELAAVLGHEIGHVTARHSVNQLSRAQLAQLGLGIGMIAAPDSVGRFGEALNSGLGLLFLKYGRDDERQADELGFRYMLDHEYDVREMEHVFAALQASGDLAGRSAIPTWLASHPSEPERIANVQDRISALDADPNLRTGAEDYMRRIDGLVYGEDPRKGYFAGDMFYHPELAFEFAVPEDWQRQNMAQAVVGVSPNQNAALQLTLVPREFREAAREFVGTQGVTELGSDSRRINGQDAVVSQVRLESGSGALIGLVAHIADQGSTYRLLTYAPEAAYGDQERLFERIIDSFDRVTDADVLDVEAARLHVVDIDRPMTIAELAREYPSPGVSVEELAVINQVAGPQATLRQGMSAKAVTGTTRNGRVSATSQAPAPRRLASVGSAERPAPGRIGSSR